MSQTPNAKEQQLARVRRNQQRCRERKRAHMASLEEQIRDLQERLRQCTPCTPTAAACADTSARVREENDARRVLLLSLGISDVVQQQYIDSPATREAVRATLRDPNGLLGENESGISPDPASHSMTETHIPDWWDAANAPLPLAPDIVEPAQLALPFSLDGNTGQKIVHAAGSSELSVLPTSASLNSRQQEGASDLLSPCHSSLNRCFLDTALTFRPGNATTPCSIAISMAMQHNRKGLSLAELHERMKPGFTMPSDSFTDCSMNNDVLLRVLAEIISG